MLLQLDGVGKSFAARRLFADVTLEVRPGDRIALVGPNGAGKTTLLKIAAGLDPPDEGRVVRARGLRLGLLRQEIDPSGSHPVREEAGRALAHLDELQQRLAALETEMSGCRDAVPPDLAERYDAARAAFELGGGFERDARIDRVLAGLGFDDEDRGRPLSSFSGGWLMRVELAKLLLSEPDVLLLDEPTNHLDLPSIQWFEATLDAFPGAVIAISHDRTFLRRLARRVAELAVGRFGVYEGGWDRYLADRAERRAQLEARKKNQDRRVAETERFIERFRYKASKARQVQSRVKALEKLERVELDDGPRRRMRLRIPPPARAGEVVLGLADIHKAYGDTLVYRGVDLEVKRGDRVALVGPNGAGKSTLLRIAAGALPVDRGERRLGHNVRCAFYAQHQLEVLDPTRTVLEELEATARTDDVPRLRSHLGAFLFSGDDVDKKVSVLSGGEKARLALARMLLRPANFLILDEPTNHLDVEACEVLEEGLAGYSGTLVLISHDRSFINAIATRVVEVRGGVLREFPGNYDAYLERQAARPEPASPAHVPGHGRPHPPEPAARPAGESREDRRLRRERTKAREKAERRLAALEAEILEHETRLEEMGWRLGAPELHRDPEAVRSATAERDELKQAIEALYREWERLAAEIESLDAVSAADAPPRS